MNPFRNSINCPFNGEICVIQDSHRGLGLVGVIFDPLIKIRHIPDELLIRRSPPSGPLSQPFLQFLIFAHQGQIVNSSKIPAFGRYFVSIRYDCSTKYHRTAALTNALSHPETVIPETPIIVFRLIEVGAPEQIAFQENAF
jgi:hypothetical protein